MVPRGAGLKSGTDFAKRGAVSVAVAVMSFGKANLVVSFDDLIAFFPSALAFSASPRS